MEKQFELEIINTIARYTDILKEQGYLVKLKFWGGNIVSLNGDVMVLKNTLSNCFYNVFETLLREGGSFNYYELESLAIVFDVTTNEVIDFLNNMMDVASKVMYKKNRDMEDIINLKVLYVDMERFRINYLRFILEAMMDMVNNMSKETILKYDNIFIVESLEYGGR